MLPSFVFLVKTWYKIFWFSLIFHYEPFLQESRDFCRNSCFFLRKTRNAGNVGFYCFILEINFENAFDNINNDFFRGNSLPVLQMFFYLTCYVAFTYN